MKVKEWKLLIEKNSEHVLYIEGEGYEGEGIGKIDGYPIFIKGALKGEKVSVKIIKTNKNYGYGKILEILEPSESRVTPSCALYKRCGGCNLQHMSYEKQLQFKKARVEDCLKKIGGFKNIRVEDTLGMEEPHRYRNKVMLPVGKAEGKAVVGFYAPRSHDIIDMDTCLIQHEEGDKVVEIIKYWMDTYDIKAYDESNTSKEAMKGRVRHVMVRKGYKTGEIMVVIVTSSKHLPHKEELVALLTKNIEGLKSIIQNINDKATNVVLGLKSITLWGSDTIKDYIGEFRFNISPLSFFQVNPFQTEVLYGKALEFAGLTGEEVVFDAYCGTGTISLFLSQKAKKVYGVEIVPEAIEDAKINAMENEVDNVEFLVGEAEKVIPEMVEQNIYADVIVVDPPRKGCGRELLDSIGIMKPKTLVYVSCDPSTLARDMAILVGKGYEVEKVQPVDMFPFSSHVESVVLMKNVEK